MNAKTTLRSAFIVLVLAITAGSFNKSWKRGDAPRLGRRRSCLQARCRTASLDRLFAIMSMGYEAELHSQAGRARWRRGVPERCPAPEFSQSGRGARSNSISDQPGGTRTRGARRRRPFHPHDAQCRPHRSRRTVPVARQAGLRGIGRRKRGGA